jgi:hypothetical protein
MTHDDTQHMHTHTQRPRATTQALPPSAIPSPALTRTQKYFIAKALNYKNSIVGPTYRCVLHVCISIAFAYSCENKDS